MPKLKRVWDILRCLTMCGFEPEQREAIKFFHIRGALFVCVYASSLSLVQLFATSWTVTHQSPLIMGSFRQEYWMGLSFPSPGDLSHPGTEPASPLSPALQAHSLPRLVCGSAVNEN